jgi:hypothetical protein
LQKKQTLTPPLAAASTHLPWLISIWVRCSPIRSTLLSDPLDNGFTEELLIAPAKGVQRRLSQRLSTADWRGDTSDLGKKLYAMGQRGERFYLQANALQP